MTRWLGTSFRTRLILGAVLWVLIGTGISWWAVTELFRHHVVSEFESELDHHATELAAILSVMPDGRPLIRQPLSDHRFAEPASGYYWQVDGPGGAVLRSVSLGSASLPLTLDHGAMGDERTATVSGPNGPVLLLERINTPSPAGDGVRIGVAIDAAEIDSVMADLSESFALALGIIALGLIGAAVAQVTFGLQPLGRIGSALDAIRRGNATRLPDALPAEVAPLARSLNTLLDAHEEVVRRARIQAGNLAHALKTPLAILMDEAHRLNASGQSGAVVLREAERMRRQIDYHLARARAAASSTHPTISASLAPAVEAVVAAISRQYRDRHLLFDVPAGSAPLRVACEADDLHEMLGNIIDNAAKWARSRITIRWEAIAAADGRLVRIVVEDDGPGLPEEAHERVFSAGQRLDEAIPGSGLGLAIVREIVGLYRGRVWIARSPSGGAALNLELPVAE